MSEQGGLIRCGSLACGVWFAWRAGIVRCPTCNHPLWHVIDA